MATTPTDHRRLPRAAAMILAIAVVTLGLVGCEPNRCTGAPASGTPPDRTTLGLGSADTAAVGLPKGRRPKPPAKKPCPPKKKDNSDKPKMRGANGQQITSKTLHNGTVGPYKYRIDVENPAPGKRPGSLHVQLGGKGSTHYEYDARSKIFKTRTGERLPRQVQDDIHNNPEAQRMIKRGLRYLGEG